MSLVNKYKHIENRAVGQAEKGFRKAGRGFLAAVRRIWNFGTQRFTVMFIPHSEKKIFNFKISLFALVFIFLLFTGILTAFFVSTTTYTGISRSLEQKSDYLQQTEASLEVVRKEIHYLQSVSRKFEDTLNNALRVLGLDDDDEDMSTAAVGGDISSFFGVQQQEEGMVREISELKSISAKLQGSINGLDRISELLKTHEALFVEFPTLWPLGDIAGRITTPFGPAEHPFTKQIYLHKGIDIGKGYGTPILSTAEGKVVEKNLDNLNMGNYIVIRHKYGIYTKYGHLQNSYVNEGDFVSQGQVIGAMGSTGISTGPHLHYQVQIGSQVVDPMRFLNIQTQMRESK